MLFILAFHCLFVFTQIEARIMLHATLQRQREAPRAHHTVALTARSTPLAKRDLAGTLDDEGCAQGRMARRGVRCHFCPEGPQRKLSHDRHAVSPGGFLERQQLHNRHQNATTKKNSTALQKKKRYSASESRCATHERPKKQAPNEKRHLQIAEKYKKKTERRQLL